MGQPKIAVEAYDILGGRFVVSFSVAGSGGCGVSEIGVVIPGDEALELGRWLVETFGEKE